MNLPDKNARRYFLRSVAALGAGLVFPGCGSKGTTDERSRQHAASDKAGGPEGIEVTAVEDLMREHGVLRRALFIYSEAAVRLRSNPSSVAADALQKTAKLFRAFGEDYHEKKLEEAYIFPAVRNAGGPAAACVDVLIRQHQRGREITDYILAQTQAAKLTPPSTQYLGQALESLVRMYRPHAAQEDTAIFPAWKQTLSAAQLDEIGDKFEDIEHEQFGQDGFEHAVRQVAEIEASLNLADLTQFTAPPPPVR